MAKILDLVYRVRDEATVPLKKIKSSTGDVASGFLTNVAAAGVLVGALKAVVKQVFDNIKSAQALTSSLDDLSDKFGVSIEDAKSFYAISKIMNVPVEALERSLTSLSKAGLDPTIAGLREAKARLDAVTDPGERVKLGNQLLGKSYKELAELMGLSNEEFEKFIELGPKILSMTAASAQAQDEFNRNIAQNNLLQEAANGIIAKQGGLTLNSIKLWLEQAASLSAVRHALIGHGVEAEHALLTTEKQIEALDALNKAEQIGIDLKGKTVDELIGLIPYMDQYIARSRGMQTSTQGATGAVEELRGAELDLAIGEAIVAGNTALAVHLLTIRDNAKAAADEIERLIGIAQRSQLNALGQIVHMGGGGGGSEGPAVSSSGGGWISATDALGRPYQYNPTTGGYKKGYAHGGEFEVGGTGGTDSVPVGFMASPGETVTITPPGGGDQVLLSEVRGMRSDLRRLPTLLRDALERA